MCHPPSIHIIRNALEARQSSALHARKTVICDSLWQLGHYPRNEAGTKREPILTVSFVLCGTKVSSNIKGIRYIITTIEAEVALSRIGRFAPTLM